MRYADDHLLGFAGPKAEAEQIKRQLAAFLRDDLALEPSPDKTLITHARTSAARFLVYDITVQHDEHQLTRGRRAINGQIGLRVPRTVVQAACTRYFQRGKPARRPALTSRDDYDIVKVYGAEYRGTIQYYLLAGNIRALHRLRWAAEVSLLKTLASKHRSTVTKMSARYRAKIDTPVGPRRCYEAVVQRAGSRKPLIARFGGIPLRRQETAVLTDRVPGRAPHGQKELVTRLHRGRCELCERTGPMRVHHIGKLAELDALEPDPPAWAMVMTRRHRKALVVCARLPRPHPYRATRSAHGVVTGEPDARKRARPVRREAARKRTQHSWAPRRAAHPALDAKNEAGLDHYQVRGYRAWYAHVTLAMLAAAYLAATRALEAKKGDPQPVATD